MTPEVKEFINMEEPFKITLTFPEDFQPITYEFARKIFALVELFDRKQKDYGPENISEWGRMGVLIRMNDKIERIKHLTKKGKYFAFQGSGRANPLEEELMVEQNESLRDSYKDVAVYAIIDWLLEDGVWK